MFGGPSQPEPLDGRGGIRRAQLLAQGDSSVLNANQYENDAVSNELELDMAITDEASAELAVSREVDRSTNTRTASPY